MTVDIFIVNTVYTVSLLLLMQKWSGPVDKDIFKEITLEGVVHFKWT